MSTIKLIPDSDIEKYVVISADAFPGWGFYDDEDRRRDFERLKETAADPHRSLFGLYRQEELLGGMLLYDFDMTFASQRLMAGGLGRLAVDLLHKKEKVAHDMVRFFAEHYREREMPMLLLYPFRPDFYHQMGFGYGPKLSQYRFRPVSLPSSGKKERVRFLTIDDAGAIMSFYNQFAENTHGMILRRGPELNYYLNSNDNYVVGFEVDEGFSAYVVFKFESGKHTLDNYLKINEFIYRDRQAMKAILTFLRTQLDQVSWIIYVTEDQEFHQILSDPRDDSGYVIPPIFHQTNQQGVGLMYRIIDVPGFFHSLANHRFGSDSLRLRLRIHDTFFPENETDLVLDVDQGAARIEYRSDADVELEMAIAEFSSLAVGVIRCKDLVRLGLAEISDVNYLEAVDSVFRMDAKPMCYTRF